MAGFKPEDSGKMNFYLSVVDDLLKQPDAQPSVGMILCQSKKNTGRIRFTCSQ